jgi:hypothetical protein
MLMLERPEVVTGALAAVVRQAGRARGRSRTRLRRAA